MSQGLVRRFGSRGMAGLGWALIATSMSLFTDMASADTASGPRAASPADVQARPTFGALTSGQIVQIQSLGRSVLAAKHSQQPSEQEQNLVTELRALASSLEQVSVPDAELKEVGKKPSEGRASRLRDALQPHLTRLHEHRMALRPSRRANADAEEAEQARVRHLQDQAADIERSVQNALALPDQERHARLAELSRRLKPRGLDDVQQEQGRAEAAQAAASAASGVDPIRPTPTLTTLIQHRPGPDDVSSGSASGSQSGPRSQGKSHPTKH